MRSNDMVIPFGRFRGRRLSEVTDNYLAWLDRLPNLRPPLKDAVSAELIRRSQGGQDGGTDYREIRDLLHEIRGMIATLRSDLADGHARQERNTDGVSPQA